MERVLTEVRDGELSLPEMVTEFKEIKKLRDIQERFINETGVSSWEEVEEKFPSFADPDSLDQFRTCNFSTKTIPQR